VALARQYTNGRLRLMQFPGATQSSREQWLAEQESLRRQAVEKRRLYLNGNQYDEENATAKQAANVDRLPEHLRLHAYSTQIGEAVEFITDQLAEQFLVTADDSAVQGLIDAVFASSEVLTAGSGSPKDVAIDDVLRDALTAGDTPVRVQWDMVRGEPYLEFWDSEQVFMEFGERDALVRVIRDEVGWQPGMDGEVQVNEKHTFDLTFNALGVREARYRLFVDDEEQPRIVQMLGLPFIPWTLLRADAKTVRAVRGESLITDQAMNTADRYNAVEQVSWLIARYNSHGNLVVVGDAAMLQLQNDDRIQKDVADVLRFPGGTAAFPLALPTDPKMIEHQRQVLADHLYAAFGLTRVDPDTLSNIGGISGYALEILNRKTEGTFRRIRRRWVADVRRLLSMVLDLAAYKQAEPLLLAPPVEDFLSLDLPMPETSFWDVDPMQVYANRGVEIRMGSGYIVDDVLIRDDFVAGLISRAEALRRRGTDDTDIAKIQDEIKAEEPPPPPVAPAATGTKGGTTLGSTKRG
jgi:hypothetical protein